MRKVIQRQLRLGETSIAQVELDPKSRDDIPQVLRGLLHIYNDSALRERVFEILREIRPHRVSGEGKASPRTGRPGMEQWKILVLGTLRLALNIDYDRLQELANQHGTIRQVLGHGLPQDPAYYNLQTIKDNVQLFTPELLDRINQEVVRAGHDLLKHNPEDGLRVRCDSFVVETDVHYPTDANLLLDAIRKLIEVCASACEKTGITEWRQSAYHIRKFKKSYRRVQRLRHSSAKDEAKRQARTEEIHQAYGDYLDLAQSYVDRARTTREALLYVGSSTVLPLAALDSYMAHAERQIDQIRRRVLEGERISHSEKVFSIFQPHTEWISKGKAGVPVEPGLRVCVVEDQHRFIVHHQVMEKVTDERVAVSIVKETKERFPCVKAVSMDKGFYSPANLVALRALVPLVVLPKKGRLSEQDRQRETSLEFIALRHEHSAVESAINALEGHGLDQCPDLGITGFKRYVALAVLARNIQRLGALLREKDRLKEKRRRKSGKKAA